MKIDLNCPIVGARSYVQGTMLINKAIKELCKFNAEPDVTLNAAKFTSLLHSSAILVSENEKIGLNDSEIIGHINIDISSQSHEFYFIRDDNRAPINMEDPSYNIDLTATSDLSGSAKFENIQSFAMLLDVIVQSNKQLHQQQYVGVSDIWFTGLRNASLNIGICSGISSGSIIFENVINTGKDGQFQSVSKVKIMPNSKNIQSMQVFPITFAYKL